MSAAQIGNTKARKLTDAEVILIRQLYATGDYTQKQLGVQFNIDQTVISDIIRRTSYKSVI
jgi:DNA-binding MarR family transcriptional regulator